MQHDHARGLVPLWGSLWVTLSFKIRNSSRQLLQASSHGVLRHESQLTWDQIHAISTIENMKEVRTYHSTWILGPKREMDAFMATLFGGEACNLCWINFVKQKTRRNSQHKSYNLCIIHHPSLLNVNHVLMGLLRLKSWDLASMLGLGKYEWDLGLGTPFEPALSSSIYHWDFKIGRCNNLKYWNQVPSVSPPCKPIDGHCANSPVGQHKSRWIKIIWRDIVHVGLKLTQICLDPDRMIQRLSSSLSWGQRSH